MEQKIWLITGISSGLGKALAQAVMDNGDFVIGTFRHSSQVEEFNTTNSARGFSYQLDITDDKMVAKTFVDIQSKFDRIDVLVNNAGVGFVGAVEETSKEELRKLFDLNLFATHELTRTFLPLMRQQKNGHIIQISSHGGIKAFAGFGAYNASKFALEGLSEAMAQELAPLGIKVSLVEPGPFRTNFAGNRLQEAAQQIADYDETAGTFRTKLKGVHGKQEGDPKKAARSIIDLTNMDNPPLRLPLGKTALVTIGMKLDSVKADLDAARPIAEAAVFEEG